MLTRWFYRWISNIGTLGKAGSILDEAGKERTYEKDILVSSYNWIAKAKIGTGTSPEAFDQFNLDTPYLETTNISVSYTEEKGYPKITIKATFDIPDNIKITEVGLFGKFRDYYFMIERTLLSEPLPLVAGQTLEVSWVISLA